MDTNKILTIARDVLARLDNVHYRCRLYGDGLLSDADLVDVNVSTADLRDVLDGIEQKCTVCLLGGCVLSKARLYDAAPAQRFLYRESSGYQFLLQRKDINDQLTDIFGEQELYVLESWFEAHVYMCGFYESGAEREEGYLRCQRAAIAGRRYGNNYDRVRAAMENLIANNGRLEV